MNGGSVVAIKGLPAIRKRLDELDGKDRQNLERRAVRAGAKPIAEALKSIAAASRVPRSFSSASPAKMVRVSASMRSGNTVHALVRPPSPLFNILQPGATSHTIKPRQSGLYLSRKGTNQRAKKLSVVSRQHPGILAGPAGKGGWDETGRKRKAAFFSRNPVQHPGLKGTDLLGPALESGRAESMQAIARVMFGQDEGTALGTTP